jgi:hypothetical protein
MGLKWAMRDQKQGEPHEKGQGWMLAKPNLKIQPSLSHPMALVLE